MILDLQLFDFSGFTGDVSQNGGRPYQGQTTDRKIKQYNKTNYFDR